MFVAGNVADNTTAVAIGVSVPCIAVVIVAVLFYCYKVKNRYHRHTEVSQAHISYQPD